MTPEIVGIMYGLMVCIDQHEITDMVLIHAEIFKKHKWMYSLCSRKMVTYRDIKTPVYKKNAYHES